jgi:gliding motility-associated-like protein
MQKAPFAIGFWLWLLLVATNVVAQDGNFVYEGHTSFLKVQPRAGVVYTWELYNNVEGINLVNTPSNCPPSEACFVDEICIGDSVEVNWHKAGYYYFKVMATSNCTNNLKLGRMEVREFPAADMLEPEPVCSGDTATVTIELIKGARPMVVTISDGDYTWTFENITETFQNFPLIPTPTLAGEHKLWVTTATDVYGMTNDTIRDPVTLVIYPLPEIEEIPSYGAFCVYDDPVVFKETEGVFTYNGNVITGWDPANPGPGIHEVYYTVTDPETGCVNSWLIEIIVYPLPNFQCPSYGPLCLGDDPIYFTEKGVFTYQGQVINGWNPDTPGSFLIRFLYIDNETGCEDWCEFTISVHEAVIANAGPDQVITIPISPYSNSFSIVETRIEGNNPYPVSGEWTFEPVPSNNLIPLIETPFNFNTRVVWSGITKGVYVFRWTIFNIACPDSHDEMTVELIPMPNIPDGFTPDGDGIGDGWVITGLEHYPDHVVRIYNHWGTLVYQASPYDTPWNGVANSGHVITGKGQKLPAGVYFYVITLEQGLQPISGAVHLLY